MDVGAVRGPAQLEDSQPENFFAVVSNDLSAFISEASAASSMMLTENLAFISGNTQLAADEVFEKIIIASGVIA